MRRPKARFTRQVCFRASHSPQRLASGTDEVHYIQAFARIIGVKEDDALAYSQRKNINALVENTTQLPTTPA